jgi:hypothetical protein
MPLEENIRNQTVGFSKTELTTCISQNTCCILTSVLKHGQAVIEELVDVGAVVSYDAENATHRFASSAPVRDCFLSLR